MTNDFRYLRQVSGANTRDPEYNKHAWYCPSCNNGDEQANIFLEIERLRKVIRTVSSADFFTHVICVNKNCVQCKSRWIFRTNGVVTHEKLP